MRRLMFLAVMFLFVCASIATADFELYGPQNEVRIMDFDSDGDFIWRIFPTLAAAGAALGLDEGFTISELWSVDENDVYLSYQNTQTDSVFRAELLFGLMGVDVEWAWTEHPHVHFLDYPEQLDNQTFHPGQYHDIVALMGDLGYYDADDDIHIALDSLFNNMQIMVDNARRAWGLEVFPGSPPPVWTAGVEIDGGDWYQYGDTFEYYIARVDIHHDRNLRSPDVSAAWRPQSQRRFKPKFDSNDILSELVYNATGVQINYDTNVANIAIAGPLPIFQSIPRHGWLSIESRTGDKWYVAQVSHRLFHAETSAIELRVDPHAKNGEFTTGQNVNVQIEQTNDD